MISIYASKMYRSKSFEERSKIKSAIENPVNAELVKQIKTYLDIPEEPREEPKDTSAPEVNTVDIPTTEPSEQKSSSPSPAKFTPSVAAPHAPDAEPADREETEGPIDTSHDAEDDKPQTEEPEEPKKIESEPAEPAKDDADSSIKPVKSSTGIFQLEHSKIANAVEEIQGMLNLQDTTSGVSRISVKDNEFWIYYNDDVNLNGTMGAVIELLNASGYNYLTFNRLARSNNAIVFEISFLDTDNKMQPRKDVEDGKKD